VGLESSGRELILKIFIITRRPNDDDLLSQTEKGKIGRKVGAHGESQLSFVDDCGRGPGGRIKMGRGEYGDGVLLIQSTTHMNGDQD